MATRNLDIMSSMLAMASRRIPRAVIRTLNKYLDKSISEVIFGTEIDGNK